MNLTFLREIIWNKIKWKHQQQQQREQEILRLFYCNFRAIKNKTIFQTKNQFFLIISVAVNPFNLRLINRYYFFYWIKVKSNCAKSFIKLVDAHLHWGDIVKMTLKCIKFGSLNIYRSHIERDDWPSKYVNFWYFLIYEKLLNLLMSDINR